MATLSLVVVVAVSTEVGIGNARFDQRTDIRAARVLVNLDRLPPSVRSCYIDRSVDDGLLPVAKAETGISIPLGDVRANHLSAFAPDQYDHYRELGPPLIAACK